MIQTECLINRTDLQNKFPLRIYCSYPRLVVAGILSTLPSTPRPAC
jgi:hypothetical protein